MRNVDMQAVRRGSLALAVLMAALISPAPDAAAWTSLGEELVLKKVSDELFWEGVVIDSAQVADDALCDAAPHCYESRLTVPASAPGSRLRIGFSAVLPDVGSVRPWADFLVKSPEMHFEVQLYEPGAVPGTDEPTLRKENGAMDGLHGYSVELEVGGIDAKANVLPAPPAGIWTIRVVPMSVVDMGFRMRATLEKATAYSPGLQLPDLRLNPPFELNFRSVGGSYQPGAPTDHTGPHPSCMAEEIAEALQSGSDPPQLCLRFSMGLENVGVGPLELVWGRPADEAEAAAQLAGIVPRHLLQWHCDFLGQQCAQVEPDRGIVTIFHAFHVHEHWQDAWSVRLLRISDPVWDLRGPGPAMTEVGQARKLGINPTDELLANWHRFSLQSRAVADPTSGCLAEDGGPCGAQIRLGAGWADVYEWNRGGNYVDFPQGGPLLAPAAGTYVLQGEIDPLNLVAESDESNNRSYALFEVRADGGVKPLERGYGAHPWDNRKTISLVAP